MSSNTTPFKKRANPFDDLSSTTSFEEERKPEPKPKKVVVEAAREKYTATMEKSLRKKVKVAAAMAGIQVSTFIEEACKEKLEREDR